MHNFTFSYFKRFILVSPIEQMHKYFAIAAYVTKQTKMTTVSHTFRSSFALKFFSGPLPILEAVIILHF